MFRERGEAATPWWAWVLGLGVVGAAAFGPYVSTLGKWFVGDDFGLVVVFSDQPTLHALGLFTAPWQTAYGVFPDELRPTVAASYQFDSLWGATNPVGYHLQNVALHVVCAWLVVAIAGRVAGLPLLGAVFAGLLFALLPVHAEAVGWISGRADTIPALFYLATLLAYVVWRQTGRWAWLALASGVFFLALFSKQSAITMVATLAGYDLMVWVRARLVAGGWRAEARGMLLAVARYLPFVALTVFYLGLRLALFGNAVREGSLSGGMVAAFLERQPAYLAALLTPVPVMSGAVTPLGLWMLGIVVALVVFALALFVVRREARPGLVTVAYFGLVWYAISVAPLAVTYFSTRHLYLMSAGWPIALAVVVMGVWQWRGDAVRAWLLACGVAMLVAYSIGLDLALADWNRAADVSERITVESQALAATIPEGSILLLGAPPINDRTFVWTWATPFALQRPFVEGDLYARVRVIEPLDTFCCERQWWGKVQAQLTEWRATSLWPPVYLATWTGFDGIALMTDATQDPGLLQELERLAAAPGPLEATEILRGIFRRPGPWP